MAATPEELGARIRAARGLTTELLAELAALRPGDAFDALVESGCADAVAPAIARLGRRLADALALERYLGVRARDVPAARVVVAGLIALHGEPAFAQVSGVDVLLRQAVEDCGREGDHAVCGAVSQALRALPIERQAAVLLIPGAAFDPRYVAQWRSLALPGAVIRAVIDAPDDERFPSGTHPAVMALLALGREVEHEIHRALRAGPVPRHARRAMVSALTRLGWSGGMQNELLADPDPLVRRFVRAACTAQVPSVPRVSPAPEPLQRLFMIRHEATYELIPMAQPPPLHVAGEVQAEAHARDGAYGELWAARGLPRGPLHTFEPLAGRWLLVRHGVEWGLRAEVLAAGMRACVAAALDEPLMAWCVADLLCRLPPEEGDPIAGFDPEILRGGAFERAVVDALIECLAPEDCGNPAALYAWLVARRPGLDPECPAMARGLRAEDPVVRAVCERATGVRSVVAPRALSLAALRDAFGPMAQGESGIFALVALDHAAREWTCVSEHFAFVWERRAYETCARAMEPLVDGTLAPEVLARRLARLLGVLGFWGPDTATAATRGDDPDAWIEVVPEPMSRDEALAGLAMAVSNDRWTSDLAVGRARAGAFFDVLGRDVTALAVRDTMGVAYSVGLFVRDASARYSALIAYANDQ